MYKWSIAGLLLAATLVACPGPTGTITAVNVTATPPSINTGASSALTANVTGTGAFSSNVEWSIDSGGGSLAISGTGATFLAPSQAGSTTIKATSKQDSSKSGTVTVTVNAVNPSSAVTSVSITPPANSTLNTNATVNLVSVLVGTGSPNTAVNWSKVSGGGTLSNQAATSVTFTAPATASSTVIRATSVQDSSKFGEITLTTVTDATAPKIASTTATNATTVVVVFNEPLAPATVTANKFTVLADPNLAVSNAVLSANNTTVTLTTQTQTANSAYALLVATSVTDAAGNNYIVGQDVTPNAASFSGFAP